MNELLEALTTAAIVAAVTTIPVLILIWFDERREARRKAMAAHPSNYAVIPVVCPTCLNPTGEGHLCQSGDWAHGHVVEHPHKCPGAAA